MKTSVGNLRQLSDHPRASARETPERSWDWLLADGECPICGRRHSRWIRRVAAWLGGKEAA